MTTDGTAETAQDSADDGIHRRGVLRGLALGTVALGAGALGGVGAARAGVASSFRQRRVVVEVACLGELWREAKRGNPADDGDFRGAFSIEGWIYPEGTIKGDGFIPREDGSIGRWFCWGAQLIDSSRPEPHTSSQTMYVFGQLRADNQFPRNSLQTVGLEGTLDRSQTCWRTVVGGTGEYVRATGEMSEVVIATNTSLFVDGTNDPSPCWRCEFDLWVPD